MKEKKKAVNWQRPLNCARKHFYHMSLSSQRCCVAGQRGRLFLCSGAIIGAALTQRTMKRMINLRWAGKRILSALHPIKSNYCQCTHTTSAHREVIATTSIFTVTKASLSQQTLGMKQLQWGKLAWTFHNGSFWSIKSTFTREWSWLVQYHFFIILSRYWEF